MRMTIIKRNIARIVAASMALAMLAPAAPTYAAEGTAAINFDLDTLNTSKVGTIMGWTKKEGTSNVVQSGSTSGSDTSGTSTFKTKLDQLTSGQSVTTLDSSITFSKFPESGTDQKINLPWWDGSKADASKNYYGEATTSDETYATWNFDGYKLLGWYRSKEAHASGTKEYYLSDYGETGGITYYAAFTTDSAKTYQFLVEHKGLPSIVPTSETKTDEQFSTMTSVVVQPLTVPGYKATTMEGGLYSVGTDDKITGNAELEIKATNNNGTWSATSNADQVRSFIARYGFSFDQKEGTLSGMMVNKGLKATVTYEKDTSQQFAIQVVHHIMDKDGKELSTYIETKSLSVEDTISGVQPDQTRIMGKDGGEAMYNLVTTDTGSAKAPTLTRYGGVGFDDADTSHKARLILPDDKKDGTNAYISNLTKKTDSDKTTYTIGADSTKSDDVSKYALTGSMINSDIQVDYYYTPNANYKGRVEVVYKDNLGNTITDAVVAKAYTNIGTTESKTDWYQSGSTFIRQLDASATAEIQLPELAGYQDPTESHDGSEDLWQTSGKATITKSSDGKKYDFKMSDPAYSGTITITYNRINSAFENIASNMSEENVTLKKDDKPFVIGSSAIELFEEESGTVTVKYSDLPLMEENAGYINAKWYLQNLRDDGTVESERELSATTDATFTVNGQDYTNGGKRYKLVARAVQDTSKWVTYQFAYGNKHQDFTMSPEPDATGYVTVQVPTVDTTTGTNITSFTWKQLLEYTGVEGSGGSPSITTTPTGYTTVWRPAQDISQTMDESTDLFATDSPYRSGGIFYAYYESSDPAEVETMTVDSYLDISTTEGAIPTIEITSSLNPATVEIVYVVTDSNDKVVGVFKYTDLYDSLTNTVRPINQSIGLSLHPGQNYKLYQVKYASRPAVGDTFPSATLTEGTDYSTAVTTQTPVAYSPKVVEDDQNPSKVAIRIYPVTSGYQYALKDSSGKVVCDYTLADRTGQVIFRDLEADTTYYVYVSPDGKDVDGQIGLAVTTDSISPSASTFSVEVVTPSTEGITITVDGNKVVLGSTIEIDGTKVTLDSEDSILKLDGLKEGQTVKITLDEDFVDTYNASFSYIEGITKSYVDETGLQTGNSVEFEMPSARVMIQIGDGSNENVTWATASIAKSSDIKGISISAINPTLDKSAEGTFRVRVVAEPVRTDVQSAIKADEKKAVFGSNSFEAMVYIEKQKTDKSGWEPYDGTVSGLILSVNTGGMPADRRGRVYNLGTVDLKNTPQLASASMASSPDEIDTISSRYFTLEASTSYQGSFSILQTRDGLTNGSVFAFAYITEPTITITDLYPGPTNKGVQRVTVKQGETLAEAMERMHIATWELDGVRQKWVDPDTGITYTYEGLYEDEDGIDRFDENQLVDDSYGLYMYFSDDSEDRAKVLKELETAISTGNVLLRNNMAKYATKLQLAIDAATLVLEQTSPKATTAQLRSALEGIQAYIATKDGSSGGSSSGGGGSSTRKDTTTTDPTAPVVPSPDKIIIPSTNVVEGGDITLFKNFYEVGVDGNWEQLDSTGENWKFHLTGGTYVTGSWALIRATYNGQKVDYFYHFDANGLMDRGWLLESTDGHWYYLSEDQSDILGHMFTGWVYNKDDGRWYYLDTKGDMVLGWKQISGRWYYFAPSSPIQTWSYNTLTRKWHYNNIENDRPMGSLYINESTPDGYSVDTSGALRVVNPS